MALSRTTRLSSNSSPAGFGTGSFTTASFTPSNNSLLVVAVAAMETGGTTDPSGDITISGGGLTWTARATIGKSASFSMGLRIFTAPVTTGASMTLTVDCGSRSIERYVISAVDYTGYDTGTPTGATATDGTGAVDGAETLTLSAAPAAGSEVFAALASDTGSATTPGTGWAEIHDNQALGDCGIQTQARIATLIGPTFSSAGAGAITEASGGALSPASPATVNSGDLLVIFAYYEGTTTTPSTPSGFTLVDGPRTLASNVGRCWVFAKVADGSEDGASNALGTPAVTTMRAARCYRFINVRSDTVANVVGGFAFDGPASSATVNDVGVTTPEDNCLAVNLLTVADDNAVASFTGETGGDWTEAIAEYTSAATTPDYCQQLQTAAIAAVGTVNGGSLTMAAADPFGVVGFYIRGAGANFDPVVSWADISTGTPPGSVILAAIEIKVASAVPSVAWTPGELTVSPVAWEATPGQVAVAWTPGQLTASPVPWGATPGPVTIGWTTGQLTLDPVAWGAAPIPPSVAWDPGTLTLDPVAWGATPGQVVTAWTPAELTLGPVAWGATPGPVSIAWTPGTLTLDAVAWGATPQPVSVAWDPGTLTLDPVAWAIGGATIAWTSGGLTLEPVAWDVTSLPVSVPWTPGDLTLEPVGWLPVAQPVTIVWDAGVLTVMVGSWVPLPPTPVAALIITSAGPWPPGDLGAGTSAAGTGQVGAAPSNPAGTVTGPDEPIGTGALITR